MSLYTDPRYRVLATAAAKRLGTSSPNIVNAILAQWSCEKGQNDLYPPVRNNPGNLARGAAAGLGFRFYVTYPNPQPANPIVTFYTPMDGALAYAKLLAVGSRYAAVRAACAAGNGYAFIIAIGRSHYGTTTACMLSVYRPATPPRPAPPPPASQGADMAILVNAQGATVVIPAGGAWFLDGARQHLGAKFGPAEVPYVGWVPNPGNPSRAVIVKTAVVSGGAPQDTIVYVSGSYALK